MCGEMKKEEEVVVAYSVTLQVARNNVVVQRHVINPTTKQTNQISIHEDDRNSENFCYISVQNIVFPFVCKRRDSNVQNLNF